MGEVINLNRFRKAKRREDAAKTAAGNRVLHGVPKLERERNRDSSRRLNNKIEAHRIERDGESDGDR